MKDRPEEKKYIPELRELYWRVKNLKKKAIEEQEFELATAFKKVETGIKLVADVVVEGNIDQKEGTPQSFEF